MKREIKFRGKRIRPDGVEDAWAFGSLIQRIESTEIHDGVFTWFIYPETVGQFTGYYDKREQDIYDKDIIKEIDEGRIWLVEWNSDELQWWICDSMTLDSHPLTYLSPDEFIKIGNIHDNPELIAKEEKK